MKYNSFVTLLGALLLMATAGWAEGEKHEYFWEAQVADCWTCGGVGRLSCQFCGPPGDARYTCGHCERLAPGARLCRECQGRDLTEHPCLECKGVDLTRQSCLRCNGSGRSEAAACIFCAGSGKRGPCSTCNGKGRRAPCAACDATGRPPACRQCTGDGACAGCAEGRHGRRCQTCFGPGRVYAIRAAHPTKDDLIASVQARAQSSAAGGVGNPLSLNEKSELVAEDGSVYGQINPSTRRPKTVFVHGYFRPDGAYVKAHFQELSSHLPGQTIIEVPRVVFEPKRRVR